MPSFATRLFFLLTLIVSLAPAGDAAPFIDAKAISERFPSITAQDMLDLRQRRVLIASKSMGLNLVHGLGLLGKQIPTHDIATGFQRFDVQKHGGLDVVPVDAWQKSQIVHIMATRYPVGRRVEEVDQLLRQKPWELGAHIDVVMIVFVSEVSAEFFPSYRAMMDVLARDFPRTRFIHCTSSVLADGPDKSDRSTKDMLAFSDLLRTTYRGKAPIFDLAAILSDDFREGAVMRPEYSRDPTGVHPNQPAGEILMAKGFILAMHEALRWKAVPPVATTAGITPAPVETLPATHPEYRAVRAILDHNGLTSMRVEGQTVVRQGHIVGLFIQDAGVTEIPEAIGELTQLEQLHCYADRTLGRPLLRTISPAIARCTQLSDLRLNNNALTSLPGEIVQLGHIQTLALAGNHLRDLPRDVATWVQRYNPTAMGQQLDKP